MQLWQEDRLPFGPPFLLNRKRGELVDEGLALAFFTYLTIVQVDGYYSSAPRFRERIVLNNNQSRGYYYGIP